MAENKRKKEKNSKPQEKRPSDQCPVHINLHTISNLLVISQYVNSSACHQQTCHGHNMCDMITNNIMQALFPTSIASLSFFQDVAG